MSTGLRFTLEVDGLPPDAFAVVSFHLNQSLSSLFSLDLSLVSQQFLSLEFAQVLDKMAYLTIWQGDEVQRRVKGVVTWFELGENDKNQMLYSMKVHPPLWRAGLRQNFRIFQNEDIKSILGTMLQENGVTEWSPLFSEPHPSREFCVQYGETDYDFLCRMAAEEGIFFYEEHAYKSTDQSLVLCDTVRHLPESFEIPWNPNTRTEVSTLCISQFRYSAQIRPSSVVTKDYTFKRPGWAGRFEQEGQHQDYQRTQYEVYDYPGRFKSAHGQNFARWQMDGWRNNAETARGMSRSPEIWPGRRIVLTGHPQANLNREWQVVASELHGEQPQAVPGRQGAGTALENHFAVIPADRTWRPQPLLKPLVDGPQSAVVTGPAGEEIFCDEHGRVRVKFNWDRYNPADQDSSCWIRVAQAWAGTGFGHLAIPRVGQEVIVDFLNGDPDQPIIMGRTYHQENRTPGSLPGTKTQMTIRSKTYMGSGFNELKFDDATGREQVYIHAQKNMDTSALADNIGTSAEELGLSDYRHFVIYPRLDKALKAQKNNDEATAIREFEYIHQQVPDNIPLTLYLAEAYRHFGHDDRARLLLEDQLKRHPGDARLERSLAAIPVEVKSVTTVEELLAQQKACDAAPTLRCRSEVGQNALRLAQLPVARAQLNDATFAASPEGKTLRTDLLQRAIYLKQWSQADTLYNEARQQNTLSAAERRQWFDVLLAGQLDDRILALQSQGIFTDPQSYITYATALAYRGEKARLQHYLIENKPLFTTDAQEKSWLYLLSKYSANPVQALANYTVQFADNRQYVVGATLPVLLKEGQYDAAQKLLATLPANEMLEERYAVSVATRNKAESLRLARLLYQQEPANLTRLDQLTWQLMQNEQSREAADLLLQRYPFQGDARVSQTLMARLASLLESHPYLATPAKVAILSKPLPLAAQRQWQSQLPGIADNCPAIVRLLGDMSPSYDAAAWNRLAKCYRDTLPGVALYAWLQAEQRQPNAWQHRAVAYQAYQVEDYATALAAWQKISLHDMSNEDLLAAANTAQAAGNGAARDRWLQQAEQRGLGNNALYWWLHAQRYIPGQPELALSDLTRSINIAPSANAYVARATIYRQRHNVPAAVSDLRAALELEPNNSNIQAALGYALWDSGDIAQSREMLEQAHKGLPDDPALIRQLAYVNQRLDDMPATQHYARLVIDDIDNQALINPLTPEQNQQRFNFRRLHEEVGRRWTFSFDSSIGLRSGAMSTANNNVGGAAPGKSYRSYGQLEAEYRIGRNMLLEGDLLSVYSRVFADTGENGVMMPVKNPMSGTGLRWKPLRDQIFFLAVEQQLPLNGQNGASDTMLRASASFFNGGKYSDEWHPNGSGWFAQNLYLDAAQYIRQDIQAWTADYRVSWHQKVANGQTIEPYAHVQDNGYRDKGTQGAQLGGVGVRWNIWTGETHYDAWPHKVSLGVEYQHTFKAINQRNGERNNAFLTIGVHW
ncbi:type VI secretion system tip protein VgrG [Escherichia coli]|nr:type VI secretion system tip protein VgrG [Escherichia coli]